MLLGYSDDGALKATFCKALEMSDELQVFFKRVEEANEVLYDALRKRQEIIELLLQMNKHYAHFWTPQTLIPENAKWLQEKRARCDKLLSELKPL